MEKWWLSFLLSSRKPKWDLFCSRVLRSGGETGSHGREKKLNQRDVARVHRSLGALLLLHLLTSTVTRPPLAHHPSDLDPRFVLVFLFQTLSSMFVWIPSRYSSSQQTYLVSLLLSCFVSPTKLEVFDMERVFLSFRRAAQKNSMIRHRFCLSVSFLVVRVMSSHRLIIRHNYLDHL